MDQIDGTQHDPRVSHGPPPSQLVIVLDTNPYAWEALSPLLPLPTALANLIVFINAHLAFSHDNKIAVIASHCQRTRWLYPPSPEISRKLQKSATKVNGSSTSKEKRPQDASSANKYGPFAAVESSITASIDDLICNTSPEELSTDKFTSTPVAAALSLALNYINRQKIIMSPTGSTSANNAYGRDVGSGGNATSLLSSRILVVSTSGDLASQYIPLMNAMFAAQNERVPIDILKLAGDSALLQQASFTTGGIFIQPDGLKESPAVNGADANDHLSGKQGAKQPISIMPYLMQGLLPDAAAREHILSPTTPQVDFRAACFCHRRVVDIGFVCSICLSIFCSPHLPDDRCLTCGSRLVLGETSQQQVLGEASERKKEKKKKKKDREGRESGVGTPAGQEL